MLQRSMVRLLSFITLLQNGMLILMFLTTMEEALCTGLFSFLMFPVILLVSFLGNYSRGNPYDGNILNKNRKTRLYSNSTNIYC
jgi:hypothetical protein